MNHNPTIYNDDNIAVIRNQLNDDNEVLTIHTDRHLQEFKTNKHKLEFTYTNTNRGVFMSLSILKIPFDNLHVLELTNVRKIENFVNLERCIRLTKLLINEMRILPVLDLQRILTPLTELTNLNLHKSIINGNITLELNNLLIRLIDLDLSYTGINRDFSLNVNDTCNLRTLKLNNTNIIHENITNLRRMNTLQELNISNCNKLLVDRRNANSIISIPNLINLTISIKFQALLNAQLQRRPPQYPPLNIIYV
jgi:hypothetical protein